MILETLRAVTDALNSEIFGVNVQIPNVTRDSGDSEPPTISAAYDETRSNAVAVGTLDNITYPLLAVTLDDTVTLNGEVTSGYRDATITILIRYMTRDSETALARSHGYYTLRATEKALAAYMENTHITDRVRNGVQLISSTGVEHIPMLEMYEDAIITGALRVELFIRDTTP